jgi:hypothetical protein
MRLPSGTTCCPDSCTHHCLACCLLLPTVRLAAAHHCVNPAPTSITLTVTYHCLPHHCPAVDCLLLQLDLTASHLLDVCTVRLPSGTVRARPRSTHVTPPELICVPDGCSLDQLKRLVTDAFADVYRLAVGWRCEQLLGLPEGALAPAAPAAVSSEAAGQQHGEQAAAAGDVADAELLLVGCKVPPGCDLTAVGSGLDPEPRWVCKKLAFAVMCVYVVAEPMLQKPCGQWLGP